MTDIEKMISTVKPEDVEALVELFDASDWDEMHLKIEGLELFLSSDPGARLALESPHSVATQAIPLALAAAATTQGASTLRPTPVNEGANVPADWVAVKAPNLGTFYRAPKPGAAAYVELGQVVTANTEICLIEVMKLFTAVRAGTAGTVRKICVDDAEMVEYGQTLFYVEPA